MKTNRRLKKVILYILLMTVLTVTGCSEGKIQTPEDNHSINTTGVIQDKEDQSEKNNHKESQNSNTLESSTVDEKKYPLNENNVVFTDDVFKEAVIDSLDIEKEFLTKDLLKNQTELHIEGKNIKSLEDLKYFPNLKVLYLGEGIQCIDDISPLENLIELEELYIIGGIEKNIRIQGDWQVVSSLENLKILHLEFINYRINIKDIAKCKNLTSLTLKYIGVSGDISELTNLKKLNHLSLSGNAGMTGQIRSLSVLKNLRSINLSRSGMIENLEALSEFVNLEKIHIEEFSLNSDITDLKNLKHLKEIELQILMMANVNVHLSDLKQFNQLEVIKLQYGISVKGNIEDLKDLKYLKVLRLGGSDFEGDIEVFSKLENLREVSIHSDYIYGDIKVFSKLENLREVRIYSDYVYGDIKVFSKLENLREVSIHSDYIYGDIGVFKENLKLTDLFLTNTSIEGDISTLNHLPLIESIDIRNAYITGKFESSDGREVSVYIKNEILQSKKSSNQDNYSEEETVLLTDVMFEEAVIDALGIEKEFLTKELLKNQTELHIWGKDIKSLKDLKYFPNLKVLHLGEGIQCIDDISPLENLIELEELYIIGGIEKNIRIQGDWQVVSSLENLKILHLEDINYRINIKEIAKCKNLTHLTLRSIYVFGDISELTNLKNLNHLELIDSRAMTGQISSLLPLEDLRSLTLRRSGMIENLEALSEFVNLEKIHIGEFSLNGDITDLKKLKNLKEIELQKLMMGDTNIYLAGDINVHSSDLKQFNQLEVIELRDGISVKGNIEDLKDLKYLKVLRLGRSDFEGDIEYLSEMRDLEVLDTGYSGLITGDIEVFSKLENLREVSIHSDSIYGDIEVFSKLKNLRKVDISSNSIYGNIGVFKENLKLTNLYLTKTSVEGDISILNHLL